MADKGRHHRTASDADDLGGALASHPSGSLVRIFAKPRASRSAVVGLRGEDDRAELAVSLAAPPADGAANQELERLLGKIFALPRSRVRLQAGHASRHKVVLLEGLDLARAGRALRQHLRAPAHG